MASLLDLPLPPTAPPPPPHGDRYEFESSGDGESGQRGGSGGAAAISSASICPHAVARGTKVLGLRSSSSSSSRARDDDIDDGDDWIAWEASFGPAVVRRVASSSSKGGTGSDGGDAGVIVAASTSDGNVSLLRGADGGVLATRRVVPPSSGEEGSRGAPGGDSSGRVGGSVEVSFVAGAFEGGADGDALIILAPPTTPTAATKGESETRPQPQVVLVSGINGAELNGPDKGAVVRAATRMSVGAVTLDLRRTDETTEDGRRRQTDRGHDDVEEGEGTTQGEEEEGGATNKPVPQIAALGGCFVSPTVIRFVAVDTDGTVSVHNHDLAGGGGTATVVSRNVLSSPEDSCGGEEVVADAALGIKIDDHSPGDGGVLFAVAVRRGGASGGAGHGGWSSVCWYDLTSLELLCRYDPAAAASPATGGAADPPSPRPSSPRPSSSSPVLLAMGTVSTYSPSTTAGMAVALRETPSSAGAVVRIVQVARKTKSGGGAGGGAISPLSDDDDDDQPPRPAEPHVVFEFRHDPTLAQSSLDRIDLVATGCGDGGGSGPYSARLAIIHEPCSSSPPSAGEGESSRGGLCCREFSVEKSAADLVGRFRHLLSAGRFDEADELLVEVGRRGIAPSLSPYASVHGSDVALGRLRSILATGGSGGMEREAKDCLRRLGAGAVSGGQDGVRCLVEAATAVSDWPNRDGVDDQGPNLRDFRRALMAASLTVGEALKAVPPQHAAPLKAQKDALHSRARAMKALEAVLSTATHHGIVLSPPLSEATSVEDLFQILVARGAYASAEKVRRADPKRVDVGVVAGAVMSAVTASVRPSLYRRWIADVVVPRLGTPEHPLMDEIGAWACRMADAYDDAGGGEGDGDGDGGANGGDDDVVDDGLDSAIELLSSICEAMARLSTASYFTSASCLSATPAAVGDGRGNASLASSASSSSFRSGGGSSSTSTGTASGLSICVSPRWADAATKQTHHPTLLQLGLRSGGGGTSLARRVVRRNGRGGGATPSPRTTTPSPPNSSSSSSSLSSDYRALRLRFGDIDEEDGADAGDCEGKLRAARELRHARSLGLDRSFISLREYSSRGNGAAALIAIELVRIYTSSSLSPASECDEGERSDKINGVVRPYCETHGVDLDDVIQRYTRELCDGNGDSPETLGEVASLSRCCVDPRSRCLVALRVLRAAPHCSVVPPSLSSLAGDALKWAGRCADDTGIGSDLEEASRLLRIDSIIRKYCGGAAREFFRVSDPRHGPRLLDHVCRFVDVPTVIGDALDLCDAFTHLSRVDACVRILRRTMLAPGCGGGQAGGKSPPGRSRADHCASQLRQLYVLDGTLAEEVGGRVVSFASWTIRDGVERMRESRNRGSNAWERGRREATASCSAACALLATMQENNDGAADGRRSRRRSPGFCEFAMLGSRNWSLLLREMRRLSKLQEDFSIFLTLSELRGASHRCDEELLNLLRPALKTLLRGNNDENESGLRVDIATAKRGCALLYKEPSKAPSKWFWAVGMAASRLVQADDNDASFRLLKSSGMLDNIDGGGGRLSDTASVFFVSVSQAFCAKATHHARGLCSADNLSDSGEELEGSEASSETLLRAMKCIARASHLLQEHGVLACSRGTLVRVVAMGGLVDLACQALVRADGGTGEEVDSFRRSLRDDSPSGRGGCPFVPNNKHGGDAAVRSRLRLPSPAQLHPRWYVGDGLLLPPSRLLSHCMAFLNSSEDEEDIFAFLNRSGVHTLALRLLSSATAIRLSRQRTATSNDVRRQIQTLMSIGDDTARNLAERSLGGSGNGITSGTIDSQLAVAHLFSLPSIKLAFKVYRSALPSAISRRDFGRVLTLATIGVQAVESPDSSSGWKKQARFLSQCRRLASNAIWWQILQRHTVDFDPRQFGEMPDPSSQRSSSSRNGVDYAASLVPALIYSASQTEASSDDVLSLAQKFCVSFSVDPSTAPKRLIEFILTRPSFDDVKPERNKHLCLADNRSAIDAQLFCEIEQDLRSCETASRVALDLLPSAAVRSAILRRCVMKLESSEQNCRDYERLALALSLYRKELSVLVKEHTKDKSRSMAFRRELGLVERRLDALAVLSSFFKDERRPSRPTFSQFFEPLAEQFDPDKTYPAKQMCGVIGNEAGEDASGSDTFDPLTPLLPVLAADVGVNTAKALSAICHSLSLPQGYVHARWLQVRFLASKGTSHQLPSFEMCVVPVLDRLKDASDVLQLAEWCSLQYVNDEDARLACLEKAHLAAMKVSDEAELRRHHASSKDDATLLEEERRALDKLKQVGMDYADLADRVKVKTLLNKPSGRRTVPPKVRDLLSSLVEDVQKRYSGERHLTPELFVEGLLTEASMKVAVLSLEGKNGLTMEDFRYVASRVHGACSGLAEEYSHVHVGACARALARRWLVHGDEVSVSSSENTSPHSKKVPKEGFDVETKESLEDRNSSTHLLVEEEDTIDFVMDLNEYGTGEQVWSDDVGSGIGSKSPARSDNVTVGEEPSAFKSRGSAREMADYVNARSAIRISFVSFAKDYFCASKTGHLASEELSGGDHAKENTNANTKTVTGLASCFEKAGSTAHNRESEQNTFDIATEHATELLRIVFAESAGSGWKKKTPHNETDATVSLTTNSPRIYMSSKCDQNSTIERTLNENSTSTSTQRRTITFSMRDRALRTASILCPQEILESVIVERGYFTGSDGTDACTLERCRFGAYVAMEIESMGLPLPHSDLVQLSMMHFSSYARALWRHHGRRECQGFKGRLLHLLLDLCTKDEKINDPPLVVSVLHEMSKLEIPRTLLSAFERLLFGSCTTHRMDSILSANNGEGERILSKSAGKAAQLILGELDQLVHRSDFESDECIQVVQRLIKVVTELGEIGIGEEHFGYMSAEFCRLAEAFSISEKNLSIILLEAATEAASKMKPGMNRSNAFKAVVNVTGGQHIVKMCSTSKYKHGTKGAGEKESTLSCIHLIGQIESSLNLDIHAVFEP